ncbi:DMT family transporter [Candidatus Contubernalis alkaliaceticus]|uniref:DMT family transporter n=1 Tax=Candidatus Contubernalis alkaliaceticus TaxID=338645 RepID=UPI001F4C2D8D|nr:DMT family transporter [Candidatus Contubernalis alkalaceticus]UNC91983.1 DMT family transporter [Candidatus Contubernalis alkalaceticus]
MVPAITATIKRLQSLFLSSFIYILIILPVLLWGSSFVATKIVLRSFTPMSYMFIRFAGASILFGLLLLIQRSKALDVKTHGKLALLALFQPGLYFAFETLGLQLTSASSASMIIAGVPAAVSLMASLFLQERLNKREWIGIILSVAGVLLIALFDDNPQYAVSSVRGNFLVFLAVISAAVYMVLVRSLTTKISVINITAYQFFYGGLFFLPLFLIQYDTMDWLLIEPNAIAALGFLIILSTVVAFLAYNYALSKIKTSHVAVFINGIPLVTILTAGFVLGEKLGYLQLMGGLIIIAGVTLTNLRPKKINKKLGKKVQLKE